MGQPLAAARASAASRYALGACSALMAWALRARAPAASLITASRSALRAEGAARLWPVHRAGQPLAAIADSRYALGAEGVGAARPVACGSRVAASRYALGAEGVGATRPGAYFCSHPDACARCLLVVGMSKTSCAARCSRRSVQGALRAPAEGEGGLARREDLTAAAAATLERSAGTVAHGTRAARERRRRRAKVSRRRRALGGARACRAIQTSACGAHGRGPLERRRADSFFLGLGFPTLWTGSVFI